ncbi:MAG: PD-(D/E)XK nuclease family protein [Bdellovibrionales bacterium]
MKNVFTIEPDLPFLDTLAAEVWKRTDGDGFTLSRHLIFLPTRRACRALGMAFAKLANGKPVLLPRMRPLGDIDEDELSFADEESFNQPPALAPLKRQMLLAEHVKRRDPALSWDQAVLAADALARFLDQIQIEQCDISKLPELVEEQELAEHWQQTLLFLEIVTKNWPRILGEQECQDPVLRRNAVVAAQIDAWRKNPPKFPIIAAGSTGSIPSTANLLVVLAEMPAGAVILPGLDRTLDNDAWSQVDETHPQHSMKMLLEKMGVERSTVADFSASTHKASARIKLLSEAMRPAGLTDAWRELQGKLDKNATAGLTRLTLGHPQEEAQVIALRLREALETPNKTAAFVTADRALAGRVAVLLRRWGIKIDDSGGAPLASLPPGTFLNLVLAAAAPHAGNVDILAMLKHPLAACGLSPAACRAEAREAEVRVRKQEDEDFGKVKKLLSPLIKKWSGSLPLAERIKLHIQIAEDVAASDTEPGEERLWLGESGKDTVAWLDEWRAGTQGFPSLSGDDYFALFRSLASSKILRSSRTTHPRLSILGPLEARLCDADLIILGGMNEGVWPPDVGFDPWMSRPMRKKFNLSSPEYRIGLSAHDFVQLSCAKEVMLTRSQRVDGLPTVSSRFLLQIDAVLRAAGLSDDKRDALAPCDPWREWAHALDEPAPEERKSCARPQPCPPVSLRPKKLRVTEISTWMRNPYAIYAKHILNLNKLDELDAELDVSDRGMMIHVALEKFIRDFPSSLPPDAEMRLLTIGRKIFSEDKGNPRVRAFWEAGFANIAAWFLEQERERRQNGILSVTAEIEGRLQIDDFTLTGRADRIEIMKNGSVRIIDYKTGVVPEKKEVRLGIEPQLQLLALIAASGGFKDLPPRTSSACEYWGLKGGEQGCKTRIFDKELPDLTARAEKGLKNLIKIFADPKTPYDAAPRQRLQPRHNDYAHLSRLQEWGRTGDDS